MTDERPTARPVTLSRLVEAAHCCRETAATTADVAERLDVSRRRARETLLEATRIGLLWADTATAATADPNTDRFQTTDTGVTLLTAVREESWSDASDVLYDGSPHYRAFCSVVSTAGPATLTELRSTLEADAAGSPYTFNETVVEVVGDWAERLGTVARNAFTGAYYSVEGGVSDQFPAVLLEVFEELEATAGSNLVQRYLSIPRLREHVCERIGCRRAAFDDALVGLVQNNVGRLELSGAPVDTGAKDVRYGIKRVAVADSDATNDGLVSTTQSTDAVVSGVEQFGKQYYYLAVHDRDITHDTNVN